MSTDTRWTFDLEAWEAATGRTLVAAIRDHEYTADHRPELTAEYADEWIAVIDLRVVCHDPDHTGLLLRLDEMGVRDLWPAITFMWTKDRTLILLA